MIETIRKSLRDWHVKYGEREKLQHSYIALAIIAIIVAGLLGLMNYETGQQLTNIALAAIIVFFINLLAWTLLSGLLLASIDRTETPTPKIKQVSPRPKRIIKKP